MPPYTGGYRICYMSIMSDEFYCTMVFLELHELEEWAKFKSRILPDEYLDIPSHPFMVTVKRASYRRLLEWVKFKEDFLKDPRWDQCPDEKVRMMVELHALDFEIWKRKMVPVLIAIRARVQPESFNAWPLLDM